VIGFFRGSHHLVCDGVSLEAIAEAEGTPVYVYSAATLRDRYRAVDAAFGDHPHAVHCALKANSTLAIARLVRSLGGRAEANSVYNRRPLAAEVLVDDGGWRVIRRRQTVDDRLALESE
jgi:diaminopimelate decarboxylase